MTEGAARPMNKQPRYNIGGIFMTKSQARVVCISRFNEDYPAPLLSHLGSCIPDRIFSLGNLNFLDHTLLVLFCTMKCPGDLIPKTRDLVFAQLPVSSNNRIEE